MPAGKLKTPTPRMALTRLKIRLDGDAVVLVLLLLCLFWIAAGVTRRAGAGARVFVVLPRLLVLVLVVLLPPRGIRSSAADTPRAVEVTRKTECDPEEEDATFNALEDGTQLLIIATSTSCRTRAVATVPELRQPPPRLERLPLTRTIISLLLGSGTIFAYGSEY